MPGKMFDAAVLGAGPSGLLATRILEGHGLSVKCIDPNYGAVSPQSDHVHYFAQPALDAIDRWCPGFRALLIERGAGVTDRHGQETDCATGTVWPSRRAFDQALYQACRPQGKVLLHRVRLIGLRHGTWTLSGQFGSVRSRLLIDASGRSRCTLNRVGSLSTSTIVVHEGPPTGAYMSCVTDRVRAPHSQLVVKLRGDDQEAGLLALRLDKSRWQLTITLPPGSAVRSWDEAVRKLAKPARSFLEGHRAPAKINRYGGQRSSFVVAGESTTPSGWLPLGDALFTSPPYQGNGVSNLVQQLCSLDDGLWKETSFQNVRKSMLDLANSAWMQSTLLDTLANPACFARQEMKESA